MTLATAIMYAVAATALLAGIVLLWQLRRPLTDEARYACRIAGLMLASLGTILASFATVAWVSR